jgi:hypothetical protein
MTFTSALIPFFPVPAWDLLDLRILSILFCMKNMSRPAGSPPTDRPDPALEWAGALRARGWGDALLMALEACEPLMPIGAQMLWIAQPALRLFGGGAAAGALARLLETPEGVAALKARLGADDAE